MVWGFSAGMAKDLFYGEFQCRQVVNNRIPHYFIINAGVLVRKIVPHLSLPSSTIAPRDKSKLSHLKGFL